MERTKFGNLQTDASPVMLSTFASQLVSRALLAARLGMQYDGNRDLYKALGYKTTLKYEDYLARYTRQDLAKAIIDRPVRATWQGPLELIESEEKEDTEFEKAWIDLDRKLGIKTKLSTLDKLTGLGKYGILLLGFDDVSDRSGFQKPIAKDSTIELVYIKAFSEQNAPIAKYETDPKSARYGLPLYYDIQVQEADNDTTTQVKVHYTRVIHIVDDPMESEIFGTPRLEVVFNRLMDLEKLVGGDAEMFWRGARPGYEGKVDPNYTITAKVKEDLIAQVDEFENNLRRLLINEGIELKALAQQIASPKEHFEVQIACISAITGIPQRVLMGSERGELASSQDSSEWKEYVQSRREDHSEPHIVRPLVDRLIDNGILPKPKKDYTVKWNDLYSLSEKARVDIGKARANALREYTYSPMAEAVVPPDAFFEFFLGLTREQITLITKQRDAVISEEELSKKIIESLDPKPEVVPGQTTPAGQKKNPSTPSTPKNKKVI